MKSFRRLVIVLLPLLLVLAASAPLRADGASAEARAREYFKTGTEHFEAGRYLDAQAAFAAGFELSHKPGFLWNMAESARHLGDRARAVELYQRYLREDPEGPKRGDAEKRLEELEPAPETPPPVAPKASKPLVPRAQPASPVTMQLPARRNGESESPPVYQRWWFWTGAGVVVTAAIVTGVLVASSGSSAAASPKSNPSGDHTIDLRSR